MSIHPVNKRLFALVVPLLLATVISVPPARSQDGQGRSQLRTVHGSVLDQNSNPIANGVVYLHNKKTNTVRTYISEPNGTYRFSGLDPNVDFEIHAEFWVSHDANSGIYMRCANGANPTDTTCYEANIYDERPEAKYGTGAITHLAAVDPMPKAGGKWNTFDLTVKGPRVTVVLNGVETAQIEDHKLASGPFGLQYVQGVVKFRKVQVRPL